jgi:histidine triad (HIT) family protein
MGKPEQKQNKQEAQQPKQLTQEEIEKRCIFCKIIKGEIPSSKVFENNNFIGILDISPVNSGHTLIIPKKHYTTLFEFPEELNAEMLSVAKIIGEKQIRNLHAEGFNLMMNNFPAAGQLVPHAHLHVIPRFSGDELKHWPGKKYPEGIAEKVAELLRK